MAKEVKRNIKILLVEDEEADARLIREKLESYGPVDFSLTVEQDLNSAIERIKAEDCDLVLLDLQLPDTWGLDTLDKLHSRFPELAIVVLTGMNDEELGFHAVQNGAQDYLVKDNTDELLLGRSVMYAIERHKLLQQIDKNRRRDNEDRDRSFRSLENMAGNPRSSVTASSFGLNTIRESDPVTYEYLIKQYSELLDLAVERRQYRVEHDLTDRLRAFAGKLGFHGASPREIVEIGTRALRHKWGSSSPATINASVDESKVVLLELMGHLASYYRGFATGLNRWFE